MNLRNLFGPGGIAATGFAVLTTLFVLSNNVDENLNHQIIKALYDLAYDDSLLLRELVTHEGSALRSYDGLEAASATLRASLASLQATLAGTTYEKGTGAEITRLSVLIAKREDAIEHFKSRNSTYKNSLARVPAFIDGTERCAADTALTDALRKVCAELHALLAVQAINPGIESGDEVIRRTRELIAVADGHDLPTTISGIEWHTPLLVRAGNDRSTLITKILNEASSTQIRAIHSAYELIYAGKVTRMHQVRWILFILCCLLLPLCAYAVARQSALNRDLDRKVGERTAALTHLNSALQNEVTEREHAQRIMVAAQQQLVQSSKLAALGEMAGGVAHEINTPIGVILLRSEHVLRCLNADPPMLEKASEFCHVIKDTASRIGLIVAGLRSFSRSADTDPLSTETASNLVKQSLSLCAERFLHHGVELRVPEANSEDLISCRPAQICQVLVNLLNNAHDAVCDLPEPRWIAISIENSNLQVSIAVTDCGNGIPAAVKAKIFQPFYSTKELGRGTGLGLSVSLGIVKNHGGELIIDAESPNTRFVVTLPLCTASDLRITA